MEKQNSHKGNLLDEAEAWIVKLRSENVTVDDKRAFSAWLNTSRDHIRAFDEAYNLWENLGAAKFLPEEVLINYQQQASSDEMSFAGTLESFYRRFVSPWQISIAVTCLLAVFIFSNDLTTPPSDLAPVRYETAVGETRQVSLSDGSIIELNTNSILDVQITNEKRLLNLVEGEAFFSVAPDKNRPFIVDFGKGSATAVGTAFNVYRKASNTAITVTEGIVAVRESADLAVPNPEARHITENQQVKVGNRGVGPTRNVHPDYQLSWRDKTVVFNNTSLRLALQELNRYLVMPVNIQKSNLSDLNVTGTFSLDSPDETLDALVATFDLTKTTSSIDNTLYLSDE